MGVSERKAREFKQREEKILSAALSLAAEKDWQVVTIDHIAERAEIGKGTVYKHFKSKEEIWAAIVTQDSEALLNQLLERPAPLDIISALKAALKIVWRHMTRDPGMYRLRLSCMARDASVIFAESNLTGMMAVESKINGVFLQLLQEGQRQGVFPQAPLEFAMIVGHGLLVGTAEVAVSNRLTGMDWERFLDYAAEFAVQGVKHTLEAHTRAERENAGMRPCLSLGGGSSRDENT
ncbi:MAG: TetR/AcrR family transcriptional regulator [Deltaproteobacteria bacterium]|nr:TetR/AcrR family transcriptional regulator [Deltaproteobacteria bacterium]